MVPALSQRLQFGDFVLDGPRACLRRGGHDVELRPKTFELLCHLVVHAGRVLTKDELLAAVWPHVVVTEDSLTRCISEIRSALGPEGRTAIRTMARRGYLFAQPVVTLAAAPAPTPAAPPRTNLPDAIAPPVGREADLAELDPLLAARRLVTLAGAGGVGKSRLAQWLLHQRREAFEHGVSWVDLSSLTATDLAGGVAAALGMNGHGSQPLASLLDTLRPLRMLIALDNAEHLLDEVAALVQAVHDGAPEVRLLVTSQAPLKLAIESVYRLDGLAVPDDRVPWSDARRFGAVALFLQRAQAVDSRFSVDAAHASLVSGICHTLDGLPLSIELAAARAPLLGLPVLAASLDERFRMLTGGHRGAPTRQQTLRAAMEWSCSLLKPQELRVFRRLGVFAAGFTLETALQTVADAQLDRWQVLDALSTLADRSLLAVDRPDPVRWRLPESMRAYALELLQASGEADTMRRRHAHAFRELFDAACAALPSSTQPVDHWRAALLPDLDNGRAAFGWALQGDPASAVSLAASLAQVLSSEWPQDRRRLLESTGPLLGEDLPAPLRARWLVEAALDCSAVQPAQARRFAAQAAQLFRSLGDAAGLYRALTVPMLCAAAGPDAPGTAAFEELPALEDPAWPASLRAQGAHARACWLSSRGDYEGSLHWRHRTEALHREAGNSWQLLVAQANLMDSQLAAGRVDDAVGCGLVLEASLQGTRRLAALPGARINLAAALLAQGDTARARDLARQAWPQAVRLAWQAYWADYLALLAALESRPRTAALLLGYADAAYATHDASREVNEARAADRAAALARAAMEDGEFGRLKDAGARLDDDAVARAAFAVHDAA